MLVIADYGAFCAAILVFLALRGRGTFTLLISTGKGGFRAGAAATLGLIAGDQAAFFPLFIDPASHRGAVTFAAMAATIATITLVYCLCLCAFANVLATKVKANRGMARWLERVTGLLLVGFGIKLVAN